MQNSHHMPWQVDKYEKLINDKQPVYFDVDDFEEIIDHYLFQGSYHESLQVADYACRMHPSSIPLILKKAQLLATFNKEERALELLSTVENVEPGNQDVFLTKGAIFSQMRDYEQAIAEYNKAVYDSDEPDSLYCSIAIEYENLGSFDKTLEYLGKALEVNPNNDLAIYEAAYCFDLLSLTEEGIAFFQRLIDRNPYSTEAWFNLGVSYINAGLYEKALEALEYSLAIDYEHEHSWFHKGYTLSLLNRHNEAIGAYKESIAIDETDAMKHYYIGECHEKLDDYYHARQWYLKSVQIDPDLADAWVGMAVCENETGSPEEAVNYLEKGLTIDPDNVNYLCLMANTCFSTGEHQKAVESYEKAILSDPGDEETWFEYAEALLKVNKQELAHEVMSRGLETLPDHSNMLYGMAAVLFLSGKTTYGTFCLEEAHNKNPEGLGNIMTRFPKLADNHSFMEVADRLIP